MNTPTLDPTEIYSAFDWSEDYELEFKSAQGGLPRSLWETYSAFANSSGGVILLGVKEDGTVSGVDKNLMLKLRKSFWDSINNREKISTNLVSENDVREVSCASKTVLAIRIPRASRYQRPVYVGQNPLSGTYRRNYEGDYHCSAQEVRRMMSDSLEESADSKIMEGFTLDDLDSRSLQEYRNRFSSFKPTHAWLNEDAKGFLTKIGGWKKERNGDKEGITLAAILMLGTDETIRDALPQYQINYYEKLSSDPKTRWTDRITTDGTWNANLFQFYLRVSQRLTQDLKLPFQLDENLFRKGETEAHEAVREALVNSIIHADYCGQGGIIIEKKRDQFEFSNPGSLLISKSQLIDQKSRNSISECRNKTLQHMFTMIGAAEKAGSGIDKIYRGWESQHWRKPAVNEFFQPDRVYWTLQMISLIPEESLTRLEKYLGTKFKNLGEFEVQALVAADVEGHVTNTRMCQITNRHPSDVTKLLQSLVSQNILVPEGKSRWTKYRPSLAFKNGDLALKENDLALKEDDLALKENDLALKQLSEEDLLILKKGRMNPELRKNIILKLCKNQWLTRKQLGHLLNRNPSSLRKILTPMVEQRTLHLLHPDKPNRVDQAYRTNTSNS